MLFALQLWAARLSRDCDEQFVGFYFSFCWRHAAFEMGKKKKRTAPQFFWRAQFVQPADEIKDLGAIDLEMVHMF